MLQVCQKQVWGHRPDVFGSMTLILHFKPLVTEVIASQRWKTLVRKSACTIAVKVGALNVDVFVKVHQTGVH